MIITCGIKVRNNIHPNYIDIRWCAGCCYKNLCFEYFHIETGREKKEVKQDEDNSN